MRKVRLKTLKDLEAFVLKEELSIETRYNAFIAALDNYTFFVMEVKYEDTCTEIENKSEILPQMLRVIDEVKNNKPIRGFWVVFKA